MRLALQLLVSQAAILLLSYVLAYYPNLYFTAVIAYMAILFGAQYLLQRRSSGRNLEEVLSSRILHREDNVQDYILGDEKLAEEYARIVKTLFAPNLLTIPLVIALFMVLPGLYSQLLEELHAPQHLLSFLKWLLVFETISAVSLSLRLLAQRKHGKPVMLNVPTSYEVREKGLVLKTGLRPTVIPFPLDNERYEVRLVEERGFVEIVDRKSRAHIRLYSGRPRRVYDLIRRLGLQRVHPEGT